MFFLDHWKNLLLLTSPIRILVNYLRYDTYPFLDSHTLFKGYSLTNQINASCAPLGTWLVWEDKSSLWDTNDRLNESNTYEYLFAGHGPEAWKVSGLAAWIWIEKTIIHMFVNSKNPYPFKKNQGMLQVDIQHFLFFIIEGNTIVLFNEGRNNWNNQKHKINDQSTYWINKLRWNDIVCRRQVTTMNLVG